jgi:peptide/nickel transport system substrate-binding protein
VTNYNFDVAGANALLDSAGYKLGSDGTRVDAKGAKLSYQLLVSTDQAPVADLIVAALKPIGVTLTTMAVQAGPQLFGTKLQGMYEMALLTYPGPTAGGPNGDPDLLRQVFSSKAPPSLTGASGYANPTFDGLADMQLATFDDAQRKTLVGQMQTILATDLPVLSLFYPETFLIFRKAVIDQWYLTPGEYPASNDNKQIYVTGLKAGSKVRPFK